MRILVITGSAHKKGTSSCLADAFIKGAEEAGHVVCRFDAALKNVHPCIGCDSCRKNERVCVFKDDMQELNPELLKAQYIMFEFRKVNLYTTNLEFFWNCSILTGVNRI